MICIVSAGLGNVASIRNMFTRLGFSSELLDRPPKEFSPETKYVLPGVGSFDEGIRRLKQSGWFSYLKELPCETNVLGICLGMQLLGLSSSEGTLEGIGRLPAHYKRFELPGLRVPHMGWNTVIPSGRDFMFELGFEELRFYFTHSFYASPDEETLISATTTYGVDFPSALRRHNTRGVQFHPEKSHRFGMALLKNWVEKSC